MTTPPSTPARLANALRWRSKRLWRRTFGRSAYEARVAERAAQPSWRRVDELVTPPATRADLAEANRMIEALLPAMHRPSRPNLELIVDHAIATLDDHDTGTSIDVPAASKHVHRAAIDHPAAAEAQTRRFIAYLRDSGRLDAAAAAADSLFEATGRTGYGVQLHGLQLRQDATTAANATVERVAQTLPPAEPTASLLRADEMLRRDDFAGAIAELDQTRPMFPRGHARRLIAANAAVGRHQDILDYLDRVYAGLPAIEIHIHRFDALFALGRRHGAEQELTQAVALMTEPDERVVDRMAKAHGRAAAQELLDLSLIHI